MVFNMATKKIDVEIPVRSRWAAFLHQSARVLLVGSSEDPEVQWWTIEGHLIHRFHLSQIPDCVSFSPVSHITRFIVRDSVGFVYILSDYYGEASTAKVLPSPKMAGTSLEYFAQPENLSELLNVILECVEGRRFILELHNIALSELTNKERTKIRTETDNMTRMCKEWTRQYYPRKRPSVAVRVVTQDDEEVGEFFVHESEITQEQKDRMEPFMERLVAQVLAVGEGDEREKQEEREKVVLEFFEKSRVEEKNFGWQLRPYCFK